MPAGTQPIDADNVENKVSAYGARQFSGHDIG